MGWGNYWRRPQVSQTLCCIGTLLNDYRGGRYIAHKTPNLDWTCALTVKSREIWKEWRMKVLGSYFPSWLPRHVIDLSSREYRHHRGCVWDVHFTLAARAGPH
jgi:hypothetical protein